MKSLLVQVQEGAKKFHGDLFLPDPSPQSNRELPLVIIIHEWWGKTEFVDQKAKDIAQQLGYAALAVDYFGEAKTVSTPTEAEAMVAPFYDQPETGVKLIQNFITAAAITAKKENIKINLQKIAAVGYCFGGNQALNLARAANLTENEELLGVVAIHGKVLSKLRAKGPILTRLLVLHAGADKLIPIEQIEEFKEEMKKAKADLTFHSYPNVEHSFTNPVASEMGKKFQIPLAYDHHAAQDSWVKTKDFLSKVLS